MAPTFLSLHLCFSRLICLNGFCKAQIHLPHAAQRHFDSTDLIWWGCPHLEERALLALLVQSPSQSGAGYFCTRTPQGTPPPHCIPQPCFHPSAHSSPNPSPLFLLPSLPTLTWSSVLSCDQSSQVSPPPGSLHNSQPSAKATALSCVLPLWAFLATSL